jgi:thymidylate synthase ThyX
MDPRHVGTYETESFTAEEQEILRRYFTNLEGPVFALVNLPEVVKGALFARYSRSSKSLRRLFLDEFVGDLDLSGDHSVDATVGLARAEQLYDRVFFEYGDDSVAQLGGVHLACEQASNLLTKVLERGRLMSYMEKSTRYVAYDSRLVSGRYRYYRGPELVGTPLGARYVGDMDRMFDTYAELLPLMQSWFSARHPRDPAVSDLAWRQAVRAKALDSVRGLLPAGATSNLGIYGSGQAYEALLVRMRSDPLPEARAYAQMMLEELRKVIPSWVKRVDVADRGGAHSSYRERNAAAMRELAEGMAQPATDGGYGGGGPAEPVVSLIDWDPAAETKVVAAMLYPYTDLSEQQLERRVELMGEADKLEVVRRYCGERTNRRQRPGRALERAWYRFEVVSDYGAFRDLQRHRLLTIEWQDLTPRHGYSMPAEVAEAGGAAPFSRAMERSSDLYEVLSKRLGAQVASYAVALAFRLRYVMQMNAREAMHMIELRTTPEGHPEYRKVCQQMHRLIADVAGHHVIASMMDFVNHDDVAESHLGRLAGAQRAEQRRLRSDGRVGPAKRARA